MKKLIFSFILLLLLIPLIAAQTQNESESANQICIHYFYREGCHFCAAAGPFVENLTSVYNIMLHKHDVTKFADYDLYNKLCALENLPQDERGIPLVAIGQKVFMGLDQIQLNLENEILDMKEKNETKCLLYDYCIGNKSGEQKEQLVNVSKVTLPIVTVAAVSDSINPCAIGVLVFLLSFLFVSSQGNKKRTALIAGIYIATVYLVYFLAGIGILAALAKFEWLRHINKIFAVAVGIIGIINIKDAFKDGKGTLAIPDGTKPLIEKWVYRASLPAAIILGFIVAAVELPCTGGMYLAILALLNTAAKGTAISYLIYYNFIFILPLLIITLLFIKGVENDKIKIWVERHKKKAHLLTGIILIILGIILFLI